MKIQSPKGTRDFYPVLQDQLNRIFASWRRTCLLFGYEEYEGPAFETLELFTDKSGDEIVGQLYDFKDKGGRHLALRPEMTPTLARLVNQKGRNLKKPCKWFSIPRLWRYERAQKGRLREFFQLNMDILGTDSIRAEADLLTAIVFLLTDLGLKKGEFSVGISSRRLLVAVLAEQGITDAAPVYAALDKKAKIAPDAFRELLAGAGLDSAKSSYLETFMSCKSLDEIQAIVKSDNALSALAELRELFALLEASGFSDHMTLDLNIVRGLAYYTGVIFEVFDRGKSMRALAGGGRYDELCSRLGGEAVTGVGFGMGDVVLRDLLLEKNLLDESGPGLDYYIVSFGDHPAETAKLADELRRRGLSCSHALAKQKVGKQMEAAHRAGARKVLFLDSDKAPAGSYEVKNLQTGEQAVVTAEVL